MNILQTKINKLMLSILQVKEINCGRCKNRGYIRVSKGYNPHGTSEITTETCPECNGKSNRDFSLNELLMAFQNVRKFHTTLQITNKGYLEYWEMEDCKWQVDFDLTKSVLEQSEETLQKIEEIL